MGDSFTFAIGQYEDFNNEVNKDNRWTNLIANYYNLEHYNRAIAGAGNYTILEKVYVDVFSFVEQKKRPLVVVSYSDPNRIELYNKNYKNYSVLNDIQWDKEFYKTFITNYEDKEANKNLSINYICAIQSFLFRHDIDFIDCHAFTEVIQSPLIENKNRLSESLYDIAGNDGKFLVPVYKHFRYGHANVLGNKKIADKIIEKIENLYG